MSWAFISDGPEELAALDEIGMLWEAPDRVIAIVGGSIVERRLDIAIRGQFNSDKEIDKRMFKGVGGSVALSGAR
jgi:hypothetical protein